MQNKLILLCLGFVLSLSTAQAKVSENLRFGVLSIAQPARIHAQWQPFIDYVSSRLSQEMELVVPRGFKKMKAAAAAGQVDLFYVNSHVYYRLMQEGKASPLVQMENLQGEIYSKSVVVARKDAEITEIRQLKGETIAFVSPMGAGGYLAPRAYMYRNGLKTKSQTKELFTKNLSTSLNKVIRGEVTAAAMCGLNYDLMSKKINTGELKVLFQSERYPENLIAVRVNLPEKLKNRLEHIIVSMPKDPEGRRVLEKMRNAKINRFVAYDKTIEPVLANLLEQAGLN